MGRKKYGAVTLGADADEGHEVSVVSTQPGKTETPRYQALLAAVEAGYVLPWNTSIKIEVLRILSVALSRRPR